MAEYRRRLPHIHPEGEHLFVTWRLHGSLPVAPPDTFATPGHAFAVQDRALAQSHGSLWLSESRVARQVVQAIRDGERQKRLYRSKAWVVMPNHVHLPILPQAALAQIRHWIKGSTARESNRLLGRMGQPFWQHESFDRYPVVFVSQKASQGAHSGPRNSWAQFLRRFPQFLRSFTDPFQAPLGRIARLQIFLVSVEVHSPRKLLDEDDVSRISAKRWIGSLEGTNSLCLDVLLHPRFQRTLFDKFDRAAQHLRDLLLHSHNI